ncbi:MAG TPA: hypothetical protein VE987_21670 [Polyangiaceae bacterium]|nr:hypothetical protein [Polyangiaceae bacterium]
MKFIWIAVAAAVCWACGGGGIDRPIAQFPSKAELQRLAERPAGAVPTFDAATTDRWTIETPVPPPGAAYPTETTWDRMLVGANSGASVRLAPELRCAATETARYYTVKGGYPEDALREYLLLRCGSTLAVANVRTLSNTVPDDMPDARVEASFAPSARDLVAELLRRPGEVGIGFARGAGRASLVAYVGAPLARLHDTPTVVHDSSVTVDGELAFEASAVIGLASRGPLGVAECEPDRKVRLPAFRLSCPLSESDPLTVIDVVGRKPNQVLLHTSARLMVRRSPEAGRDYEVHAYGSVEPATDEQAFRSALVDGLNAARKQAGMGAVSLEVEQSRASDRLVVPFFESAFGGDDQAADTIALGLLAGWDVSGVIRDGGIYSSAATASRSAARFLTHALATPSGRWTLLEPSTTRIAVGARLVGSSAALAVVTTYAFFESPDHRADEELVFAELTKARRDHGLPAPRRVRSDKALETALGKVSLNAMTSMGALREVLDRVVGEQQRPARGWVVETTDLKNIPFESSLLSPGPLELEVGVTHHRPPGGAWGQYAVLFVVLENSAPGMTAQRAPSPAEARARVH